ncbi:hypothetical protein DWY21_00215 [Phocaeicola plebeius]|uniref:Uncharacterized protein n=2 Tax=Phocaeicola plebeius TaxID=310297 RepID=A0A412HAQ3_9BACT|nr:hypothetical protein DWY21_00215 [Phocaeicola plebeius]RGS10617.1 hypothetical protein DWY14_00305 [Phocaeicola plebeius]
MAINPVAFGLPLFKMVMKEKEILQEIIEWLGNDTSYLSTRTDYAKGYKSGIECAKEIVESIINKHEPDLLANN